jgi:hypothetical protein
VSVAFATPRVYGSISRYPTPHSLEGGWRRMEGVGGKWLVKPNPGVRLRAQGEHDAGFGHGLGTDRGPARGSNSLGRRALTLKRSGLDAG